MSRKKNTFRQCNSFVVCSPLKCNTVEAQVELLAENKRRKISIDFCFSFQKKTKNKSVPWRKKNAVPFKDEVDRWTWGKVKKEKAMHTSVMNDRQSR